MHKRWLLVVVVLVAGCTVGPDYKRPSLDLPKGALDSTLLTSAQEQSLAYWWTRFKDPTLNRLIDSALTSNLNIALQVQRVRAARAQLGLANAQLYPTVSSQAQAARQRSLSSSGGSGGAGLGGGSTSGGGGGAGSSGGGGGQSGGSLQGGPSTASVFSISGMLNYELDVFGGLRRASQQARAQLLSSAYTQDSVRLTVISDVVTNYFSLRSLQRQIRVTKSTIKTRKKALSLDQQRYKYGAIDKLTLLQTKSLLKSAIAQMPPLKRQESQLRTSLAILTGKTPRQIMAHKRVAPGRFSDITLPIKLPKVMPSQLVERRPDVRAAEASLIAANASVGVAKSRFFPTFNLSAMLGLEEVHLKSLGMFLGPYRTSSVAGSITSPILDFGRRNARYKTALAQKRQAEIQYRQTLRQAFQDVHNALDEIHYSSRRLQNVREELQAYKQTLKLARLRYKVGRTNFFNVLDAQRNVFNTQLTLATAIQNRFTGTADLFKALGGGWTKYSDSLTWELDAVRDRYEPSQAAAAKAAGQGAPQ